MLLMLVSSVDSIAHEDDPKMAFAWRDGMITVDVQRQSRTSGDQKAFVISFTNSLTSYGMPGLRGVDLMRTVLLLIKQKVL